METMRSQENFGRKSKDKSIEKCKEKSKGRSGKISRERARERAEALVSQMTIEEMASQLKFDAPAIERLNVPEYNWWNEGLHGLARSGTATVYPQAIGLGATFDEELIGKIGNSIAMEARARYNECSQEGDRDIYKGLTIWSPNVNIFRDPRWGRGQETYGEDPYLTSRLGVSFVKGLQGEDEYLLTAACAKHFAVHSGPEADRHYFDARVSLKEMWETYLPAFETCVKEGEVEAIMGAYNRTNGEPCCAHQYLMQEVLRGKWGFEGHYVSDCWAVRDFHENHKVTSRPEESVKLALETGCDVNCGCTYEKIMNAYHEGILSEEVIHTSAVRLFTTRFLLGMFDETPMDRIDGDVIECTEHLNLASRAAQESMVLLKNDGILPLRKESYKNIAVIGPNANSRKALMGNYYGTSSRYTTVIEGIQDYVGDDVHITYAEGCHLFLDRPDPLSKPYHRLAEARAVAKKADLVILCLGLDETLEGEQGDTGNSDASGDKKDLEFPVPQRKLLEAIVETGTPFVLCVMTGSAMNLTYAAEHAAAILQTWYPGARGGAQVAQILFGEVSPSGKLPVTFYRDLDDMPDFGDYSMKGRTYRFLEKEPLYPFGYGLTYGDTSVEALSLETSADYAKACKEGASLKIRIKNRGAVRTQDVIQIYVQVQGSSYEVPNPKLAAFQRVDLKSEEEKEIVLTVPEQAFGVIDENGERVFDGKGAQIFAGFGQPDQRTEQLYGKKPCQLCI